MIAGYALNHCQHKFSASGPHGSGVVPSHIFYLKVRMFKFLRNTAVVICLLFSFAAITASASVWAIVQTQKAIHASAALASKAIQHKKVIAETAKHHKRQLLRQKAKARLRRIAVAVPVAGFAAAAYFEEKDRRAWLASNPGQSNGDYACEMAALTTEVTDDVLAGLPVNIQLPSWAIPECDIEPSKQ